MLGLSARRVANQTSAMSKKKYATTAVDKLIEVTKSDNGVSTISMARSPVNGLNLPLLTDLREAFLNAQKDGSRGVVLASSLDGIFSAGLDILEMYKPDGARVRKFWTALQDAWMALYSLDIPTAAAINGSSPAGGCMLALACEHRVMVDGRHTIGLNETQLGIVAPRWFIFSMIDTIGQRRSECALMRGTLFTPKEALGVGLIDEIAADKQEALAKCQKYIASYAKIPARARAATKFHLRSERIRWLKDNRAEDTATFLNYVSDPEVQTGLGLYVEMLKQKKSKL